MRLEEMSRGCLMALAPWLANGWQAIQTWELEGPELMIRLRLERRGKDEATVVDRYLTMPELIHSGIGVRGIIEQTWIEMCERIAEGEVANLGLGVPAACK